VTPVMTPVPRWWVLVAAFASSLVFGLSGLALAGLTVRQLCDVIHAQVAVSEETPATTPRGIEVAKAWQDLEDEIC